MLLPLIVKVYCNPNIARKFVIERVFDPEKVIIKFFINDSRFDLEYLINAFRKEWIPRQGSGFTKYTGYDVKFSLKKTPKNIVNRRDWKIKLKQILSGGENSLNLETAVEIIDYHMKTNGNYPNYLNYWNPMVQKKLQNWFSKILNYSLDRDHTITLAQKLVDMNH